jgi:large subunit ribosomal protein L9
LHETGRTDGSEDGHCSLSFLPENFSPARLTPQPRTLISYTPFLTKRNNRVLNMAHTEVLLIENIPGLGAEADIVKVRAGYARNFLIPEGKANEVTPVTLRKINMLKAKRAEREARELNESDDLARKINKLKLVFVLETGGSGKAFGSVTAADIAKRLKGELGGIEVDRHKIVLDQPIKGTGSHEISVKLHADVTAKLDITVKSAAEEAAAAAEAPAEGEQADAKGGYKAKAKARHKE